MVYYSIQISESILACIADEIAIKTKLICNESDLSILSTNLLKKN